jgi:dihydrofolate synthase/folylpolyglutamate synthase
VTSDRSHTPDRLDRPFEDPLLYDLFPALATKVEWALERTERALAMVGDPHRRYASLHVGGTNGKGSVTTTLASVMRASGRRTGCYVSPHLVSFRERIRVDGEPIAEDALKEYASEIRAAVSAVELTFFEAATLLAFHAFAREGVEVAALEVGLGGRLDSTNVVTPEVSAVTNVAMDHADYLGDTLLEIAREKAGIIEAGVPFVTTEVDPEVLGLFRRLADEVGAPMHAVESERLAEVTVAADHTSFQMATEAWGDLDVVTPLLGRHQARNAALAVAVCERLSGELRPTRDDLLRGVAAVRYRGRDEVRVIDGRTWLFDVAHNPAGVDSLVETLESVELPTPRVALVGILGDKDWRAMLLPLLDRCTHLVLTQPPTAPTERRWSLDSVADWVDALEPVEGLRRPEVRAVDDFGSALAEAAGLAGTGTVLVTGSVHTVGGAMRLLGVPPTV